MLRLLPQITPGFGYRCPLPTDLSVIVKGNLGMSLLAMRVQHAQHDSGRSFAQGPHKSLRQMKRNSALFQSPCVWSHVVCLLCSPGSQRFHSTAHISLATLHPQTPTGQWTPGPRHETHTAYQSILPLKFSHLPCQYVLGEPVPTGSAESTCALCFAL